MKLRFYILILMALSFFVKGKAQEVVVKTNALYDVTATVNLGVELGLTQKLTLDLSGNLNAWNMSDDRKWKHWMVQPEARYWFCDRFIGHFVGLHLHGGQYNMGGLDNGLKFLGTDFSKLSDSRYQGWFVGAGIGYGYSWVLDEHWSLEGELGLGYSYTRYEKYPCAECGTMEDKGTHHYLGITKAAINLIYCF